MADPGADPIEALRQIEGVAERLERPQDIGRQAARRLAGSLRAALAALPAPEPDSDFTDEELTALECDLRAMEADDPELKRLRIAADEAAEEWLTSAAPVPEGVPEDPAQKTSTTRRVPTVRGLLEP